VCYLGAGRVFTGGCVWAGRFFPWVHCLPKGGAGLLGLLPVAALAPVASLPGVPAMLPDVPQVIDFSHADTRPVPTLYIWTTLSELGGRGGSDLIAQPSGWMAFHWELVEWACGLGHNRYLGDDI